MKKFILFFSLIFSFNMPAFAETLIVCSEYGKEGRRQTQLEQWLADPTKPLSPNSCEHFLRAELKENIPQTQLWSANNAAGVYRKKMLIDRVSSDWAYARELELSEIAASFVTPPQAVLACTLKIIKEKDLRDFRTELIYRARCQWQLQRSDRPSCVASWVAKSVLMPMNKNIDPTIQEIILSGHQALAKCLSAK